MKKYNLKEARVGDKVYSKLNGNGEVISTTRNDKYSIIVLYETGGLNFYSPLHESKLYHPPLPKMFVCVHEDGVHYSRVGTIIHKTIEDAKTKGKGFSSFMYIAEPVRAEV